MKTQIHSLNSEGNGVCRIDGKVIFVAETLPNEVAEIHIIEDKKRFAIGSLKTLIQSSPARVLPRCKIYGNCGGCSWQHIDSAVQMNFKQQIFMEQLQRLGKVVPKEMLPPLEVNAWNYRHRARLSWDGENLGFMGRGSNRVVDVHECLTLTPNLSQLLPEIKKICQKYDILKVDLSEGENVLIIRFQTTNPFVPDLTTWQTSKPLQIWVQCGKNIYRFPETAPELTYSLPDFALEIPFSPDDFTQINFALNRQMVRLAIDALEVKPNEKILDAFCGLGNFSLPLAKIGADVLGLEGVEKMVDRARKTAQRLNLNAKFEHADLFKITSTKRFKDYQKWLIDPPRAGAQELLGALGEFSPSRLVYISCNPSTLARDAAILVAKGYCFHSAQLLNMFAQTSHVESLCIFKRYN